MFGWFKKQQPIKQSQDNIYTVINAELDRLHKQISDSTKYSAENATVFWRRVHELQDAILSALEKQPSHHNEIVDLQETVSELILLGYKGEQES